MSLMSKEKYLASLKKIKHRVFVQGKQIADVTENPISRPSSMAMAKHTIRRSRGE